MQADKKGGGMSDKDKVNLVLFVVFGTILIVLYHLFPDLMRSYWIVQFAGAGIFIIFIVSLWAIGSLVLFIGNIITKKRKK
jgi:hypothetical protein